MSKRTKQCKRLNILFTLLHFICLFAPFVYFIPAAFTFATATKRIVLSLFLITAGCLSLIAVLGELKTRGRLFKSVFWIMVFGITLCLIEVKPFVFAMCIISLVDELLFARLATKYKVAYATNKEIDRRE